MSGSGRGGPLAGLKIIEIAGIGPGPFCGMMLADMGAAVIRVERKSAPGGARPLPDPLTRSRRSIALDLKSPEGAAVVLRLVRDADALFEGFRPGVAERLGIGPDECLAANPKLVYGRMTGWGQDGPLAHAAGHDINYIALSGALHAIGRRGEKPVPPLNLVGDFGGGGMLLAFGMVCALLEAQKSGKGQVVDAAMVDGSLSLMAMFFGFRAMGLFDGGTGTHFLSGASHFYDTYETKDRRHVAIGSIEPRFYQLLIEKAGLDAEAFGPGVFSGRTDAEAVAQWDRLGERLAEVFRTKTRDEWCEIMEGTDVCFAPVLELGEVGAHPHNAARRNVVEVDGVPQNAPAPRFSRTPPGDPVGPPPAGRDTDAVLGEFGFAEDEIATLRERGVLS
ncbi:CaiB/BaiF CoA transferase family protein [Lentisalinibacter orientalis]|uniref:CaiB/BaiF CoA transferase family protein n=1 Tax=Lentisalinibacter orientalis TaxID=2992241 RepID=UPI003868EC6A